MARRRRRILAHASCRTERGFSIVRANGQSHRPACLQQGALALDVGRAREVFATANRPANSAPPTNTRCGSSSQGRRRHPHRLGIPRHRAGVDAAATFDISIVSGGLQDPGRSPKTRKIADLVRAPQPARGGCARARHLGGVRAGRSRPARGPARGDALGDRRHEFAPVSRACRLDLDPIYIRDGQIWTSAGVTAGIDLALALAEDDLGRSMAVAIAKALVVFLHRPGGQAQFSATLSAQTLKPPAVAAERCTSCAGSPRTSPGRRCWPPVSRRTWPSVLAHAEAGDAGNVEYAARRARPRPGGVEVPLNLVIAAQCGYRQRTVAGQSSRRYGVAPSV